MTLGIHDCLIGIEKRAERADDNKLAATFVDAAPLLASVSTTDHQVIFGRRGTGKTHILKYLQDASRTSNGEISLYVDLRSVGSNGSIYNDRQKTHAQRATPLLLDVLQGLHEALLEVAVEFAEECDLSKVGPKLDDLADAISTVEVVGPVEKSSESSSSAQEKLGMEVGVTVRSAGPDLAIKASNSSEATRTQRQAVKRSGNEEYYVKFGSVQNALRAVIESMGSGRVWLLLDEWSEIPLDIQPYLADLLRRCVLPLSNVTVKIAAIEHRSNFNIRGEGEYLGIELGSDAGGDVNLDDFMVFDNDAERSKAFFAERLVADHFAAAKSLCAASHWRPGVW